MTAFELGISNRHILLFNSNKMTVVLIHISHRSLIYVYKYIYIYKYLNINLPKNKNTNKQPYPFPPKQKNTNTPPPPMFFKNQEFSCHPCDTDWLTSPLLCGNSFVFFGGLHGNFHLKGRCCFFWITLPETNIAPENDPWKRRILLETFIFRCYVSFREGKHLMTDQSFLQ